MSTTVSISMDDELAERVRAEAQRRDQPISRLVGRILERALFPERHSPSGVHPILKDAATNETGASP